MSHMRDMTNATAWAIAAMYIVIIVGGLVLAVAA